MLAALPEGPCSDKEKGASHGLKKLTALEYLLYPRGLNNYADEA